MVRMTTRVTSYLSYSSSRCGGCYHIFPKPLDPRQIIWRFFSDFNIKLAVFTLKPEARLTVEARP